MKMLDYFSAFLRDSVNLNASRLDDLDVRVDRITEGLKGAPILDGRVLDTVPQGSWAHRTIIRPADGLEFDADFLLQLAEDTAWNADPKQYANAVWSALHNHGTYGPMSTRKDRCVRVAYANDCHIDVVPYVMLSNGREVIVNRSTNEFEDTNPVGFTEWIQEKDELTNGNLRKVIRLLKYLRDHRGAFNLKSVLLTTLVGNIVENWHSYDQKYYADVPTTLVHLVADLDLWLQMRPQRPSIVDPSCHSTSFDHRWTDAQYTEFRRRIHNLAPLLVDAYNQQTIAGSISAWRRVFGDKFPPAVVASSVRAAAPGTVVKSVAPARPRDRAPEEQFIEEMFPVDERHKVTIVCDVSEPAYPNRAARRRALRSRAGRVPKERQLLFRVVGTDVPSPYSVFWKVRNRGSEAERRGQLRGQIHADEGRLERSERTSYSGHHYTECYIVKDGACVARAREPVIIP
jgi:hypothetical protein